MATAVRRALVVILLALAVPSSAGAAETVALIYQDTNTRGERGPVALMTLRPGTSKPRLIATGALHPSWSPNGKRIAYEGAGGLVIATASAKVVTVIDANVFDTPTGSPDGKRIAYLVAVPTPGAAPEWWVANADGSGARRLDVAAGQVAWSPRGDFAWTAEVDNFGSGLFVGQVEGKGRMIHRFDVFDSLAWSPDARRILALQQGSVVIFDRKGRKTTPHIRTKSVTWASSAKIAYLNQGSLGDWRLATAGRDGRGRRYVALPGSPSGSRSYVEVAWRPR
jgi:Tol biopolymer transport system component